MKKITIQQYERAISNLSDRQIETLQILYYLPHSTATAKELAKALNYSGFQAANRQIGQIGKTISAHLEFIPPPYDSGRGNQPAYFRLIGNYEENVGWVMWDNLKKALERLKFVTNDPVNIEISERLPTEVFQFEEAQFFKEGKVIQVFTNRYERNQNARRKCINHFGTNCAACDFNFADKYGSVAMGFIEVHHKKELSEIGKEYFIDPINDLIPLCPNCHTAIHMTKPPMKIEELKKLINKFKS